MYKKLSSNLQQKILTNVKKKSQQNQIVTGNETSGNINYVFKNPVLCTIEKEISSRVGAYTLFKASVLLLTQYCTTYNTLCSLILSASVPVDAGIRYVSDFDRIAMQVQSSDADNVVNDYYTLFHLWTNHKPEYINAAVSKLLLVLKTHESEFTKVSPANKQVCSQPDDFFF